MQKLFITRLTAAGNARNIRSSVVAEKAGNARCEEIQRTPKMKPAIFKISLVAVIMKRFYGIRLKSTF